MPQAEIIDTFPAFLAYWRAVKDQPVAQQIARWASDYMAQWPELLRMQQEDYASMNLDWQDIAQERIFPFLDERMPKMAEAHKNLLSQCESVYAQAVETLGFRNDVVFLIYVGIGCGAGWATSYQGLPAVLFGLENIAEGGGSDADAVVRLTAHELVHLIHSAWREQHGKSGGSGPWWQMYSEGFARQSESFILGRDTGHESQSDDNDGWLVSSKSWLASEFLRRVDAGESVRDFFGSWFDVCGRKQCGYFLGHEVIKVMRGSRSLLEVALLDDVDGTMRRNLEKLTEC